MADSKIQTPQADPEILSEGAIPFQFELSWRSLTQSKEPQAEIAQSTEIGATRGRRLPRG
jgi:hypothetical protein